MNDDLWKQVTQMNDANLLGSLTYTTKAQQPFKIAYDYTKNGNIVQADVNGQVSSFVYDANDQLTKETLPDGTVNTYDYDAVGNRTASEVNGEKAAFTYNDANQIATKNETAYTYDKDGNLLQDEHYKYTYNQQQRLTKVTTLDDQIIASYTYDENGLRLTKTVGDTTHEYFYNDEVLDMEVVKVKDVITEYRSYEWDGYTPLGMIVKAKNDAGTFETNAYQFITNHRGDVLSIRDSEDQEVGAYTYDAYGNVLTVEGDLAKANPIRYAGYYYDDETKNYYLQARYYNPANGAFLALDPHPGDDDDPLSQNGYTYGDNNPVVKIDPDGNDAMIIIAKNAANRQGHMSLLLKVKGSWYYFYYGSVGGKPFGKSEVIVKKVKLPKKLSQVNNAVGYSKEYTTSFYISGNFDKAYSYVKTVKKNKPYYSVLRNNCGDMSINALLASMQYSQNALTASKVYSLKKLQKRSMRPNGMVGPLKNIFGSPKYKR